MQKSVLFNTQLAQFTSDMNARKVKNQIKCVLSTLLLYKQIERIKQMLLGRSFLLFMPFRVEDLANLLCDYACCLENSFFPFISLAQTLIY